MRILMSFLLLFCFFLPDLSGAEKSAAKGPDVFPGTIAKLVNQLNSTSPAAEQNYARNELCRFGKKALPTLENSLRKEKRTYVRVQIAFILGRLKDVSSVPVLEETAASPYPALNKACILALSTMNGPGPAAALGRIRKRTKAPDLVRIIDEALKKNGP